MPKYILKSLFAGIFSVTFSVSPYALAETNPPIEEIKTAAKDLKIESHKDYANYYATLAAKNPKINPIVFQQLSRTLGAQKFPKMQVQEMKYKGKDALKAIMNVNGQSIVVEFLSYGNEILKIDGVTFTSKDMASNEAFTARVKQVPALLKGYRAFQKKIFTQSVLPTQAQWENLSNGQRAEYYLRFRELLQAAYKVHGTKELNIVVSNKTFDQWVMESFLGSEAEAIGVLPAAGGTAVVAPVATSVTGGQTDSKDGEKKGKDRKRSKKEMDDEETDAAIKAAKELNTITGADGKNLFLGPKEDSKDRKGPSCIVAGYAMEWKGNTCPWNGGKGNESFYEKYELSKDCKTPSKDGKDIKDGGPGWIACNPVVYGFSASGRPHCINTADRDSFNKATHGDGPCEKASPLNSAEDKLKFLQNILKKGNVPGSKSLKVVNNELLTTKASLHEKVLKELAVPLNAYIASANSICMSKGGITDSSEAYKYKDNLKPGLGKKPNEDPAYQDAACDALMKRAMRVQDLLKVEKVNPPPAPPVIAGVCDQWMGPTEIVKINGKDECKCKEKHTADTVNNACIPTAAPAPIPEEAVADKPVRTPEKTSDCSDWKNRWNPTDGNCSMTGGDWAIGVGGLLAFLCIRDMNVNKHTLGSFCNSHSANLTSQNYVDPVAPCPATGCPTPVTPTPVDPTPPRSEETTNQNIPVIDQKVVPAVR